MTFAATGEGGSALGFGVMQSKGCDGSRHVRFDKLDV